MAGVARLGLQLYTVREAVSADLVGTLGRVAAAGYAGVETLGTYGLAPEDVAGRIGDAGLVWAGTFVGYDGVAAFATELDGLAAAGCPAVVIPFVPPERFATREAIADVGAMLSNAAALGAERGIAVGYHNHYWEMADVEGRPALAWLFDAADPRLFAEVDLYWAQVGGEDPAVLVESLGERVRVLHVKDGPAGDPGQAMTAVGAGVVDIGAVLDAARHAAWHVVELDHCDGDVFAAVEQSARYLLAGGWSDGAS